MTSDSAIQQLVDEMQISRAVREYCQACNDGGVMRVANLFTHDGVLKIFGQTIEGADNIAHTIELMQKEQGRRGTHLPSPTKVEFEATGDAARASTDFLLLMPDGEGAHRTVFAGRYVDHYVRTDDEWRCREREAVTLE